MFSLSNYLVDGAIVGSESHEKLSMKSDAMWWLKWSRPSVSHHIVSYICLVWFLFRSVFAQYTCTFSIFSAFSTGFNEFSSLVMQLGSIFRELWLCSVLKEAYPLINMPELALELRFFNYMTIYFDRFAIYVCLFLLLPCLIFLSGWQKLLAGLWYRTFHIETPVSRYTRRSRYNRRSRFVSHI